MDWEFGFSRLYIGRINSKVLLYSTGNYIQCPVISQNGKEYEKRHPQPSARLPRVRNREAREGAGTLHTNPLNHGMEQPYNQPQTLPTKPKLLKVPAWIEP